VQSVPVMERTTTVMVCVPWRKHWEVVAARGWLRRALISDDAVVFAGDGMVSWGDGEAQVWIDLRCGADDALAAVRRAVQDAPVRVASVDVINDDGGA
jgi:hypothetical protein